MQLVSMDHTAVPMLLGEVSYDIEECHVDRRLSIEGHESTLLLTPGTRCVREHSKSLPRVFVRSILGYATHI